MCERMEMYWLQTFIDYEKRQCDIYGKAGVRKDADGDWVWTCWCKEEGIAETWDQARWELEAHMFEGQHSGEELRAKVAGQVDLTNQVPSPTL